MSSSRLNFALVVFLLPILWLTSCASPRSGSSANAGTLLIVGGGLDDDSRPIYERFVALASAHGPANILIATAATGTQEDEVVDKTEALRVWAPGVPVHAIRRETSTDETVALVDAATAILFTGGDQKRITTRYRPDDHDTPEWLAMRRLLDRGGVIAGCSAGDAMMGEVMLLSGGSATALGIQPKDAAAKVVSSDVPPGGAASDPKPSNAAEKPALGVQIGPGMRILPWAITDSHFFERDRVGRLVAALEVSGRRLGLAVGEDGCIEVDLATSEVRGIGVSESLLVDVTHLKRDGSKRSHLLARVIAQGDRVKLADRLASRPPVPRDPHGEVHDVPIVEPGQNRQLASWRAFRCASGDNGGPQRLRLEDWQLITWPAADGDVAFEVGPR